MKKRTVSVLLNAGTQKRVLAPRELKRLREIANIRIQRNVRKLDEDTLRTLIKNADAAITGWGTPKLTKPILDHAPHLKLIAHSAGSIKGVVSDEVWKRRIKVTTTAPSIAISVAEYTLGLIITGLLRTKEMDRIVEKGSWGNPRKSGLKGLYNISIGLVSAGFVGQEVIKLLNQFPVTVKLFDPFVTKAQARKLGVQKESLARIAKACDVISLHAPSIPATHHMINKKLLSTMKKDVLLVNTSRGSVIDEKALLAMLKKNKEAFACLDVTDPEPPVPHNPLRTLHNVLITPHIAGVGANLRQGDYAVTEIERVFKGKKPFYQVTEKMLARMA